MRILRLTCLYPDYINQFYRQNHRLNSASYDEQIKALYYDHFSWGDGYQKAFQAQGVTYCDVYANIKPLQQSWAKEHGLKDLFPDSIVREQIKNFGPDILFFNHTDDNLLALIKNTLPKIRLTLGYSGSAAVNDKIFPMVDVVISCAPELVSRLQKQGLRAEHIHHAFNPDILTRIGRPSGTQSSANIIFIGQLVSSHQFHIERIKMLEQLCPGLKLTIFSPLGEKKLTEAFKDFLVHNIYTIGNSSLKMGVPKSFFDKMPKIKRILESSYWVEGHSHTQRFKKYLHGPIFGLQMYAAIQKAKINLNIHADSSPTHASNMRIFEVAGLGSCLLTDWKPNLDDLLVDGKECVSFKTSEEAIEKADWLLRHPAERELIAKAGQARILKDHTFSQRSRQLLNIIEKYL